MKKLLTAITIISIYTVGGSCTACSAAEDKAAQASDDYLCDLLPDKIDRWPANHMPIRIFVQPGTNVPDYKPEFLDIFKDSCQEWANASKGKISFAFVDNAKKVEQLFGYRLNRWLAAEFTSSYLLLFKGLVS